MHGWLESMGLHSNLTHTHTHTQRWQGDHFETKVLLINMDESEKNDGS